MLKKSRDERQKMDERWELSQEEARNHVLQINDTIMERATQQRGSAAAAAAAALQQGETEPEVAQKDGRGEHLPKSAAAVTLSAAGGAGGGGGQSCGTAASQTPPAAAPLRSDGSSCSYAKYKQLIALLDEREALQADLIAEAEAAERVRDLVLEKVVSLRTELLATQRAFEEVESAHDSADAAVRQLKGNECALSSAQKIARGLQEIVGGKQCKR